VQIPLTFQIHRHHELEMLRTPMLHQIRLADLTRAP
jgi:hypothetical protein